MKDNFDLKKFLKENKSIENLNPIIGKSNISENSMRDKIREMILAELGSNPDDEYDGYEEKDDEADYYSHMSDLEDTSMEDDDLYEAKKDKEEDIETIEATDTEEITPEETPTPKTGGGLEDIVADMEGTEGDLMDSLMKALKIAKGMNNEKLETQIGNTLKFFVSEYIGSGNE